MPYESWAGSGRNEKPKRDYYEALGVPPGATPEQIKSAFRKLALQHHPDRNPNNPESADKFREVREANDILSDEAKRNSYDRSRVIEREASIPQQKQAYRAPDRTPVRKREDSREADMERIKREIFQKHGYGHRPTVKPPQSKEDAQFWANWEKEQEEDRKRLAFLFEGFSHSSPLTWDEHVTKRSEEWERQKKNKDPNNPPDREELRKN